MKRGITFCIVLGFASMLHGQSPVPAPSRPPLPAGPLVKPVPDYSRWVLIKKEADSVQASNNGKAKGGGGAKTITTSKIGEIRHVVIVAGKGNTEEIWCRGKEQVCTSSLFPTVWFDYGVPKEYFGVEWISPANYVNVENVEGIDCFTFRDQICPVGYTSYSVDSEDPSKLRVAAIAHVDAKTQLPISVQIGTTIVTYRYQALPHTTTLAVPPALEAALAGQEKRNQPRVMARP